MEGIEFHYLVPRDDLGAILVAGAPNSPTLPSVGVANTAGPASVRAAAFQLRQMLALDSPILEVHRPGMGMVEGTGLLPALVVTEPAPNGFKPTEPFGWHPTDDRLPPATPANIAGRLATWLEEIRQGADPPSLRPPWARVGWYGRVCGWMRDRLYELGRPPTGPIEQVWIGGISTLLRVATTGGAVYLKGVFPLFGHEPALTEKLAADLPGAVPQPLAIETEQGWMLLDDLGPTSLREDTDLWVAAFRQLFTIQHAYLGRGDGLRGLGCPMRPLGSLVDALRQALAEDLPAAEIAVDTRRVDRVVAWVATGAHELERADIPMSLVHGDFHPGNVAIVDRRPVIFDWSDARLSHPLLDLVTLNRIDSEDVRNRIWQATQDAWSNSGDVRSIFEDKKLLIGLGAAYQIIGYGEILRNLEPQTRPHLAGPARRFLHLLHSSIPDRSSP